MNVISRRREAHVRREPPLTLKVSGRLQAPASFAQQRIWLHEHIYFDHQSSSLALYNILLPLKIKCGSMSIERIRLAILSMLEKHTVLRTAVRFNDETGQLEQVVQPLSHDLYSFEHTRNVRSTEQLQAMLTAESATNYFDVEQGRVVRCHLIQINQDDQSDQLHTGDLLAFTIHHIAFDSTSLQLFAMAFVEAYQQYGSRQTPNRAPQYIDFTLYEQAQLQSSSANQARQFWTALLHGYDWTKTFLQPTGRAQNASEIRSGRGYAVAFILKSDIVQAQMDFAASHNISMFQLYLACYYIFMFKLGAGQDMCLASTSINRPLPEMKTMIGMFANTIPYRIKLDPNDTFYKFALQVQRLCLSTFEHLHLPYQHILGVQSNERQPTPQAFFHYESLMSTVTYATTQELTIGGENNTVLDSYHDRDRGHGNGVSLFDLILAISYSHHAKTTECILECSADLFDDEKDIERLAARFQYMLEQLFLKQNFDLLSEPINHLSFLLPQEINEIQLTLFTRLPNINQGPASFAQARIWNEENKRFTSNKTKVAIYNMPFLFHLSSGSLSITKLRHALQLLIIKHQALRTALYFDDHKQQLMQHILQPTNNQEFFTFLDTTCDMNKESLMKIMHDERGNPSHFDLARGVVCRLHIVRRSSKTDMIVAGDSMILNFHHALFDFPSMIVFLRDLNQAYVTGELEFNDQSELRYLDYAIIERQMSMTMASTFWLDALQGYDIERPLSLPIDRHRVSDEQRTGRGTSASFHFGHHLSNAFLNYAKTNEITPEELSLACYFAFLFKLTNGEKDLCIGMNTKGRYKNEFDSVIGLFVNTIPLRLKNLDPSLSFNHLVDQMREVITNTRQMSYYPLQRILSQHSSGVSSPAFLDTSFEYEIIDKNINDKQTSIGESILSLVPYSIQVQIDEIVSKFDFSLRIQHDQTVDELSCEIDASLDLFDKTTVQTISKRFQTMLHQLFFSSSFDKSSQPIYELSLLLSDEIKLIESINEKTMEIPFDLLGQLHRDFIHQACLHPQKLSICLDEQSLTYAELLDKVCQLVAHLGKRSYSNEVICQCVERSIEMIIGQLGIVMSGGVYCALSPDDPPARLSSLVHQTKSPFILIHPSTVNHFSSDQPVINLHDCLLDEKRSVNDDQMIDSTISDNDVVYIVFTSGSTGVPKAVQITHQNFATCISSFQHFGILTTRDIVVQMAQCTFDVHVKECLGTMMLGATLVLLRPHGNMDFEYLSTTLKQHQVTFFSVVPSLMTTLFDHLEYTKHLNRLNSIRSLGFLGEAIIPATLSKLIEQLGENNISFYNLYGPAECTLTSVYHRVTKTDIQRGIIPIGIAFPGMKSKVLDEYHQPVVLGQVGELLLDGIQRFPGYYNRDDLTQQALYGSFYRTGDLVRQDPSTGYLYYLGRQDFQVKLRGQRIELGEIERCILEFVSACAVIKYDEYLVAYVQGHDIDVNALRDHCKSRLPHFMIPSSFIVLDRLPLNKNGKLDRKALPKPVDLPSMSTSTHMEVSSEMEVNVHEMWCQVLKCAGPISTTNSFFSVGGHSMLLMQLYHRYQTTFGFDSRTISIGEFLRHPTIEEHAKLLCKVVNTANVDQLTTWPALHLNEAAASFAQERIFLDEQIRFGSKGNYMYTMPLIYRISIANQSMSIERLRRALRAVLLEHKILRTALVVDSNGLVIQSVLQPNSSIESDQDYFGFTVIRTNNDKNNFYEAIDRSDHFQLSKGRVLHCQIIRHHSSSLQNDDQLTSNDIILFLLHHSAFDGASTPIFLRDLSLAYQSDKLLPIDENALQYIDYSVHERQLDMTSSHDFWNAQLDGYDLDRRLALPFDRHRALNTERSGRAAVAEFNFTDQLSRSFLDYASSHNTTPFQLGLAVFYAFLFKITNGQQDLCIGCVNANRYRIELQDIIGMFVAALPYRIQVNPYGTFDQLVEQVRQMSLSVLEHSHYPLQRIIGSHHSPAFLETMYDFVTMSSDVEQVNLGECVVLEPVIIEEDDFVAKFDVLLSIIYKPTGGMSCSLVCAEDLFDQSTVKTLLDRFSHLLHQLFGEQKFDLATEPINHLSLLLPREINEMQLTLFKRLPSINEGPASFAQARIWLDERVRFDPTKPKVAIYNMPFLFHLSSGSLSITKLRHALQLLIIKHQALRTALYFDDHKQQLMQHILQPTNNQEFFTFLDTTCDMNKESLMKIMHDERGNPSHFDLARGVVCRLHIVRRSSKTDMIVAGDSMILNFHHALFDFPSMIVFLRDLNQAYVTGELEFNDQSELRYLDYSIIERQMSMTMASTFWLDVLQGYDINQPLSLPFDRHRVSDEQRTGRGTSASFHFGQHLSNAFLNYAKTNEITPEELSLACYFAFLFKLTNGEKDLCIGMNTKGRYKNEFNTIIGMFVNAIPLRLKNVDPSLSFIYLVEQVRTLTRECREMSYYPLQRILSQHSSGVSSPAFLDTSFEYEIIDKNINDKQISIGESILSLVPYSIQVQIDEIVSKFDFSLRIQHDQTVDELSCEIDASLDLFDKTTVQTISKRFQTMLHQLFFSSSFDKSSQPIYELSLLLIDEIKLIESINEKTMEMPFDLLGQLHRDFIHQACLHPQKLSICLDEQSLTYAELLDKVCQLVAHLGKRSYSNEVICQCVERSIEMIIGQLGIVMSGGVYCALSPDDPPARLSSLVHQTKSPFVLIHPSTVNHFSSDQPVINLHDCLLDEKRSVNDDEMIDSTISDNDVVYIVFTSGSTGVPKAVPITHRNFSACISSFEYLRIFTGQDNIIQVAQCSFDAHVLESLGTLMIGGTVILLRPDGHLDLEYLSTTLQQQEVTFFAVVPSLMTTLFDHLQNTEHLNRLSTIRSLGFLGEAIICATLIKLTTQFGENKIQFYNMYGPAECTLGSVYHPVTKADIQRGSIPIGIAFPGMKSKVLDEYHQPVVLGQIGELLLDGIQRFPGYYNRDDLTQQALYGSFYRTGDLVRQDPSTGYLYYLGRQDFQVKLRGQRIELGEIERCILEFVSACAVIKYDEYLVAYVQGHDIDVNALRDHCKSRLPHFMIPSSFIVLDRLPLNKNGKLDRKALPKPVDLPSMSTSTHLEVNSEMEVNVHEMWCQVLKCAGPISTTNSFFSVGGHSMLLMQLYHRYQTTFGFDSRTISIGDFFRHPTIKEHAKLLEKIVNSVNTDSIIAWQTLHLNEAEASFAQERIFLDEQVRFNRNQEGESCVAAYNELTVLKINTGRVSVRRLRQAISSVLRKHTALRTLIDFDNTKSKLIQRITNGHETFDFASDQIFDDRNHLHILLHQTNRDPTLFDLTNGKVFYFQLLRQRDTNNRPNAAEFLTEHDFIVIAFHHAVFDRSSRRIFLQDLSTAYCHDDPLPIGENALQYIDYSVHERQLDMTASHDFWNAQLNGCDLERGLLLQFNRHRPSNSQRSGRAAVAEFKFTDQLSRSFLDYASSHNTTPFQLGLAVFYAFLFKITNGQQDLCIGCVNANRYRIELQDIIGMFVATLPYRIQVNPYGTFDQLVEQVRQMSLSILEHCHYPLQHIIGSHHSPAFLETMYDFVTMSSDVEQVNLGEGVLEPALLEKNDFVAKFDMMLSIIYKPSSGMSCSLVCAEDLFDQSTVQTLVDRFAHLMDSLLHASVLTDEKQLSLYQLSLILPQEQLLIDALKTHDIDRPPRKQNIIHQLFNQQVERHPQKVAVELDEQLLTYSELCFYGQQLAIVLRDSNGVKEGDIVCQCVERSVSMVIGIMSIEIAGAVYCPLSPRDPDQRLQTLVKETQSRLVLVHRLTQERFDMNQTTVNIDAVIGGNIFDKAVTIAHLSEVIVTGDSIAYIIFTSGSTGIPKAAQVRHRNFAESIRSLVQTGTFSESDTVLQMARCSFDIHVEDIIGTIIVGGTLVMLRPNGLMDFQYLIDTIIDKGITYLNSVPSYLTTLCSYLATRFEDASWSPLQSLCCGGEPLPVQLIHKLENYLSATTRSINPCRIWNLYGPAEVTIDCLFHLVDSMCEQSTIPIGSLLPGYRCVILDDFMQPVFVGQEGELFASGVGIFAGYLGRDDLNKQVLINIDGQLFYRTGDLVRLQSNNLLYYIGRKDQQVKLHGQRIELGEIERCLLDMSPHVSNCAVIKWGNDYLIAYVQSSNVDEEHLRRHCQSRLPPFMVPSVFIILQHIPLNANGKLDRKRLPTPDTSILSSFSSSFSTDNNKQHTEPTNQLEERIHSLWCEVLQRNRISTTVSIFSIGGHSLLLIQLYHRYKTMFTFNTRALNIAHMFQNSTIVDHARLIQLALDNEQRHEEPWLPLKTTQGLASFAQERIFLDEHIRFDSQGSRMYTVPLVYRISSNNKPVSIRRLRQALQTLVIKHSVLRTQLFINSTGMVTQSVLDITDSNQSLFSINISSADNHDIKNISKTIHRSDNFDVANGRMLYCQIIRHQTSSLYNDDQLNSNDIILFLLHHSAFDGASTPIFLRDLSLAYQSDKLLPIDENALQYIDYSVHERQLDMASSHDFWNAQLDGCDLERGLLLPFDRHRPSNSERSGRAAVAEFNFTDQLSRSFLDYASSHNTTPFQLGLAVFYAFLFKITNGQQDLCIGCVNANRYRIELQDIIGMFVATLPYRIQLKPYGTFDQLVEEVRQMSLSILEHSHYPLQRIIGSHHSPAFLETMYDFVTISADVERVNLDGAELKPIPLEKDDFMAKFDMMLSIIYRPSGGISCTLICAEDLFDQSTVQTLLDRFSHLVSHLFDSSVLSNETQLSLHQLSLILPQEQLLINALKTHDIDRPPAKENTIHQLFSEQVSRYSQKVAVELDEQMLTYTELCFYAQQLAIVLRDSNGVKKGDIICQCVERSISMVIGIMSIEIAGAEYCPLSPQDPDQRLQTLLKETECGVVLVHDLTRGRFESNQVTVDIDAVIGRNLFTNERSVDRSLELMVTGESIAYVIFTSGSTGVPKAAQVRHRNLVEAIRSLVDMDMFSEKDTILQMSRCSFDIHVEDILGALIIGATLVMLRPDGLMDLPYLVNIFEVKMITYLNSVPSYLEVLCRYLERQSGESSSNYLRCVCSSGETLPTQLTHKLRKYLLSTSTSTNQSRIWNHYGPAEITIGCTYHLVDATCEHSTVPIGSMAPGYRGIIVDTFGEPVFIGQEGELLVGGVGVFAGYLKRDDLTKNALVDICGEWFYRSGDLVRMNNSSLIHYVGRKDHQVKLRGQRIELGEIERCLLSVSSRITGAVVVKWGENHLIAYVQSDSITTDQLQEYCRSHLASFMVPSMFIVLEQFPLNANGKLDRKRLPEPDFSLLTDSHDEDDQMPLTPLEEQLLSIFAQAFHVNSPNVNVSFGQLGGTSLDAVTALSMIRQQVYGNVGIGVLYDNPSIRQLARVLEPLINAKKEAPIVVATTEIKDNHHRPTPSLLIEALGVVLLMCQWLLPFWIAYYSKYCFSVLLVPVTHLLSYIICQRLLLWPDKQVKTSDTLYSWRYYRWWYLERLWSINNSYWLKHILGTPIYNVYLRLCGARIGRGVHIYSTFIDAPWLLEVGDSTFIDGETILSNLSYYDQTYELHPICIGTYCSIGMFCVLYGDVNIPDHVYVESMSTVTGCYSSTKKHTMIYDRSFSWKQIIYQCICLFCLIIIHSVILIRIYSVYQYLLTFGMPIPIALAMSWLFWSIASLLTVTFFLKFVVGSVTPGNYPINSYYFLHRLWLRQLIICSFHRSYDILSLYDANANALLRWLGVDIEDDVKLCQFKPILHFPSNLLKIERGVTTFAKVVLAPFEITLTGHCYVNTIVLGSDSNLANGCILMPRTKLAAKTMVGNLTLVKQDTSVSSIGSVLLGIPARQMPFVMPEVETQTTGNTSSSIFSSLRIFAIDCMIFLICKCLFITTYWLLPTILGLFVHIGFFCFMHRCLSLSVSSKMTFTYSETINRTRQLLTSAIVEFNIFVSPFLSQTQYLVFLFRALGARIGQDVILPTTDCLTDPPLVTIGDHVRLHREAWLQSHTFEQRLYKVAPLVVQHSSVIMSYSNVLAGSILHGRNRLLPLTLVMKNDQLPFNTVWSGVPARQIT